MNHRIFTLILINFVFLTYAFAQSQPVKSPSPLPVNQVALGIVNGKAVSLPVPEYPPAAAAVRAGGEVKVRVMIDEEGNVYSAEALSGHPLLQAAAVKAARQAKFTPTRLSGQFVKVSGIIVYNFVPSKSPVPEEVPDWGIGLFFSFLQNADPALLKDMGDEDELDDILNEMAASVPDKFATDKALFEKVAKTRGAERQMAAQELTKALKKYLNSTELWHIEIGENLGLVLVEVVKHIKNITDNNPVNESNLRMSLQKLKNSLNNPPSGADPELILKFKNVADFADAPDLNSAETLTKLHQTIAPLFADFEN